MEVRRVAGALGAEITGIDLRDPELDFDAVYQTFLEHEVIFFRGAHLTAEEQLALGRRFGTPSIYPVMRIMGATEPTTILIEALTPRPASGRCCTPRGSSTTSRA